MAPVLLTDRLRLDGHRAGDLDALAALWAQPQVHGMIGDGRARPREEVWLRLLRHAGQWALLGWGMWVVRLRGEGDGGGGGDGEAIGEVGLLDARRATVPALDAPEAAWMMGRDAQGQGLAREALDAALGWADSRGMRDTCCIIDPGNAASIRLAGRVGYRAAGAVDYHGRAVSLFRRGIAA